MKIAVISLTENGRKISGKIAACKHENLTFTRYAFEKYSDENAVPFSSLKTLVADIFYVYDALIFISSCGIAVRMIAPHIKSKRTDPAVLVIDEQGKFTVSLLSGHVGGANALTFKIASEIGSVPVVTTATDISGKFSPDSFAKANSLHICEFDTAKELAARIVNGCKIGFFSDFEYVNRPDEFFDDSFTKTGICISSDTEKNPFEKTLHLVPKNIIIGVGCRKNIDEDIFSEFILKKLHEFKIPIFRVAEIHSVDLKKDEKAVIFFAERYKIPLKFYTSEELMKVGGDFKSSDFVMKTTGTDNVCERSAAIDGGRILVAKQAENGVTFAAAEKDITIDFERDIL